MSAGLFFNKVNSCRVKRMDASDLFEKIKSLVTPKPSLPENNSLRKAAVLVTLLVENGEASFGLMLRADSLLKHASQISFPGGHMEKGETPAETALRETEEEIGVLQSSFEIAGHMEPVATFTTGYLVWPVVGVLRRRPKIKLNPKEVNEFFWVPVGIFSDAKNYTHRSVIMNGEKKPRRAILFNGYEIWGVTLRIIELLIGPVR
ncbi:Uncharacterized Nudix hydrolase NudL [hydrothermal vent metagenome]|uniref:Uncharacterized Nudix hydrolase NudL n=1 Tax=hydrothermal vent metagenome TaxID=652676 RepID=A0A3B1CGV4_9ZZZZ